MATTRKTAAKRSAMPSKTAPANAAKKLPTSTARAAQPLQTAPKAAAPQSAKPVAAPKVDKKGKPEKVKVVRDSFTIPKSEYAAIAELKKRALAQGIEVKKSELLRAGLMLLTAASDAAFGKALAQVPTLKTGRPGKA